MTLSAAALPVRGLLANGDRGGDSAPHEVFKVIVDATLADGHAFGAAAARRGLAVRMIGRSIDRVWMNELAPRWRASPAPLAGFTRRAPLFCLQLLAHDFGARVVYRAEHVIDRNGAVRHRIATPADAAWCSAEALEEAGEHWLDVALGMAIRGRFDPSADELLDPGSARAGQPFYSWLIAPRPSSRPV
jgi:hypothetical protein